MRGGGGGGKGGGMEQGWRERVERQYILGVVGARRMVHAA